jgi:hypothetical protein
MAIVGRSATYSRSLLSASSSLGALLFYRRLHQFLDQAFVDARLSACKASLRSVADDGRAAVVDEGSDAAANFPAAVARAIVGVVEEGLVVDLFVFDGLWRWVEGVVYGAFEGGHVGEVQRMRLRERFGVLLCGDGAIIDGCGEVMIAQMRGGGRKRCFNMRWWREKVVDRARKVFDHEVRSRRPVSENEEWRGPHHPQCSQK